MCKAIRAAVIKDVCYYCHPPCPLPSLFPQAYDPESPAQFISTTFKNELLEAGDKWLAVSMQNKVGIYWVGMKATKISGS